MSEENAPITVTLKAGPGYEAPWVVVRADTPEEAVGRLEAVGQQGVLAKAAAVSVELHGAYSAAKGLGAQPVATQGTAPAAQWSSTPQPQAAPAGPTAPAPQAPAPQEQGAPPPMCLHGPRQFRTGMGKNGKQWSAWMCAAPKGTPGQCEPEWIR